MFVRHYCWLCFRMYMYTYSCIMALQQRYVNSCSVISCPEVRESLSCQFLFTVFPFTAVAICWSEFVWFEVFDWCILEFLSGTLSTIVSALWIPWIPIWIGTEQNTTFLIRVKEIRVFGKLVMRRWCTFWFVMDDITEKKSKWMNFLKLLVDTILTANSIVQFPAVKMEASFWMHFFGCFIFVQYSTFSSVAVFGAIYVDIGVTRVKERVFFLMSLVRSSINSDCLSNQEKNWVVWNDECLSVGVLLFSV